MISVEQVKLLGLSRKEAAVLAALQEGFDTPLTISRSARVSRPTAYDILKNLKERGLAESRILDGRKFWRMLTRKEIEQNFFQTKRALLNLSEGTQEVFGVDDAAATIHRGKETVKKLLNELLLERKDERFYGFQGDVQAINWDNVFTVEETNTINRAIKKNHLISEAMLPNGWFERQTKELGVEWAKDFEGRTTRANIIGEEYFKHGGQLFLFKDAIYLIALGEELVIEIRHSEIHKMLLAMFQFMQDNSRAIDVNALLRHLIGANKTEK